MHHESTVWRLCRRLNLKVYNPVQASQASATDLRLWSSYVQLLALLGSKQEAVKVAEKALSMVQVRLLFRFFTRNLDMLLFLSLAQPALPSFQAFFFKMRNVFMDS